MADGQGTYSEAGIYSFMWTYFSVEGRVSMEETLKYNDHVPRPVLLRVITKLERDGIIRKYRGKWEMAK